MGRYKYGRTDIYGRKKIWEDKHMGKGKYGKINMWEDKHIGK